MNDGKFKLAIVKTSNNEVVPDDEPMFFLRARDTLALFALAYYLELCKQDGCTNYQIQGVAGAMHRFADWQKKNIDKMKQPGCTRGL